MFSILARICDHILASKRMNTSTLEWIGFRRKSAGNQVFSMKYGLYKLYISVSHPHFPCEATISPLKRHQFSRWILASSYQSPLALSPLNPSKSPSHHFQLYIYTYTYYSHDMCPCFLTMINDHHSMHFTIIVIIIIDWYQIIDGNVILSIPWNRLLFIFPWYHFHYHFHGWSQIYPLLNTHSYWTWP